jgi:hypothetical protein
VTEEPAPRAPHAPSAPQTPAPVRGEGSGPDKPPQGHTALRERIAEALRTERWGSKNAQIGEHRHHGYYAPCGICQGDVQAILDVAMPVVEEALAEQKQALTTQIGLYRSAENDVTDLMRRDDQTQAAITALTLRAEQAEQRATEQHDRAVLAEAALRDHGARLAAEMRYGQQQYDRAEKAEAAVRRVREAERIHRVAHPSPVGGCPACHILAALDADQPKETP